MIRNEFIPIPHYICLPTCSHSATRPPLSPHRPDLGEGVTFPPKYTSVPEESHYWKAVRATPSLLIGCRLPRTQNAVSGNYIDLKKHPTKRGGHTRREVFPSLNTQPIRRFRTRQQLLNQSHWLPQHATKFLATNINWLTKEWFWLVELIKVI